MPCTPTETDTKDMMIQPSSWYALVVLVVAQKCLLIGMACSMAMLLGRELIVLDNNDNGDSRNIINKDYANGNDRPQAFGLFLSTPPWYHDGHDDDDDDTTTPWMHAQRLALTTVVVSFGCLVWLLMICCCNNHHYRIRYVMAGMMGMGLPLLQGTALFLVLHNDDDTATTTVGTTTSYRLGTSGKCGIAACVWFAVAGVLCLFLGDLSQPTTSWHGTARPMNHNNNNNNNDDKWEQDTITTTTSNDMSIQQDATLDNDQVDAMTP